MEHSSISFPCTLDADTPHVQHVQAKESLDFKTNLSKLNKRGSETIANAPTKAQRGGVNFKKLIDNCGPVNIPKTVLAVSIALTTSGGLTAQATQFTAEKELPAIVTMETQALYTAAQSKTGFVDVDDSKYYADAIKWAVDNKVTNGIGNNQFGVNSNVTRGQAVTFLWRAAGSPSPKGTGETFVDVEEDSWYELAVKWAVENHITEGVGDNKFDPDGSVTRGQMITFLWRTKGAIGEALQGDQWYSAAERWAQSKGLLTGTAQAYSTNADCPRCDVVYYLWKEVTDTNNVNNNNGDAEVDPSQRRFLTAEDIGQAGTDFGDPNGDYTVDDDCSDLQVVC